MSRRPPWPLGGRFSYETKIAFLSFAAGAPGVLFTLALLWFGEHSGKLRWTLTVLLLLAWIVLALHLRERVVRPLQTLANLLGALREGDFSLRARQSEESDVLSEVMREVNALGGVLRAQRLGAVEATALLHRVMEEVDVAILTFDAEARLRLINRAGERLLAAPAEQLLDQDAAELGLDDCLAGADSRTVERSFPGGTGRWALRRSSFREDGVAHHLLVLSDLSQTLREEERQAWRRLLRVLSHELNNSLAPIRSMADTLASLLQRDPLPADWREDMGQGLQVVAGRAAALSRFMAAYARLARLPPPQPCPLEISELIGRAAALETRLALRVSPGPRLVVSADPDQLEQLLINLIRNATDAALETAGGVEIGWRRSGSYVEIQIDDEGPGITNPDNLFVPFYTTKPGGSGIGLVLSRQIAEAHRGTLTLDNRPSGGGCRALLRLPL